MSTPETPVTPTVVEPVVQPVPTPPAGATPETEPLGEAGIAALKSEREARKAAEKATADALARVKEFEDRDKTESERQTERTAELERENTELKAVKLRNEVAAAKSDPAKGIVIPASLLSGSTQAELEASADALIAFRGAPAKPSAAPFIENTNKTTVDPDFDAAIEAAKKARNFALVATLRQQKAAQTKG